jgi:hypothetical protein
MFHDHTEEHGEIGTLHAELMFDELKLWSGVYGNFKSSTMTAMAASLEVYP